MTASRAELPKSEAPLSEAERGKTVGKFQDWIFAQLGRLPVVKDQLFERFKGPHFNVTGKAGELYIGNYCVSLKNNIAGNWHVDDVTQRASRQVVVRVRPKGDTRNPKDYFTVYTVCEYEGDPKTDEIKDYTDGELQLYPTDESPKTLIGDPDGVVDAAKQALMRVFSSNRTVVEPPQEIPAR